MGVGKNFLRRVAKDAAANLVHHSGLRKAVAAVRRFQSGGRRILIVSYHRVVGDFTGELQRSIPGLLISQETFRRHLLDAKAAGYQFASVGEAVDVMTGAKKATSDLCVVTFDDGYRDVYRYAFPVLKELKVPAIVYLPTAMIGTDKRFNHDRLFHLILTARERKFSPDYAAMPEAAATLLRPIFGGAKTASAALDDFIEDHSTDVLTEVIDALEKQLGHGLPLLPEQGDIMSWDEVREMSAAGIEFGAHTLRHAVLTLESAEVVDKEISESKARIEQELGKKVEHFAYCNGWYSDEVIAALKRHGFKSAVTTEDYPNVIGGDPFTLKRKVLWENFSIGMTGGYSPCLTACQLDDVFGLLGVNNPVPGKRLQKPIGVNRLVFPTENVVANTGIAASPTTIVVPEAPRPSSGGANAAAAASANQVQADSANIFGGQ